MSQGELYQKPYGCSSALLSCISYPSSEVPYFDGTNYAHWKAQMISYFRAMSAHIWWIVDIGFPHALGDVPQTQAQEKCLYLESHAYNTLFSALSADVSNEINTFESAHDLWVQIQEKYEESNATRNDCSILSSHDNNDDYSSSVHIDEVSTSSSSSPHCCLMAKREKKSKEKDDSNDDIEFDKLSKKEKSIMLKLGTIIEGLEDNLEKQEEYLIEKMEKLKALTKEHVELKSTHASLAQRYEKLQIEHTCAINSISCVAPLKKENDGLKAQLGELTSKHEDLQEKHDELLCSHENLVDSHTSLQVAHEVMVNMVKSDEPCDKVEFVCTNSCCSQANVSPSTTCDLDCIGENKRNGLDLNSNNKSKSNMCKSKAQSDKKNKTIITCFKCKKEGHHVRECSMKKEENDMSKYKENKKMAHIKCLNTGHYASMCPNNVHDDKATLSKKKTRRSKRKCYSCHEKGHEIVSCPSMKNEGFMSFKKRLIGERGKEEKDEKISCKHKRRICYTCRNKGHIGKNCPMGNNSKPIPFNNHYLLRKAKSDTIVANVVSSHDAIPKAIWVPKSLVTNIQGPNMVWVPQSA